METSVAPFADSYSNIEDLTVAVDETADAIVVEDISMRALQAVSILPGLTAKIVINSSQEIRILVLLTQCSLSFIGEDVIEVDGLAADYRQQHYHTEDFAGFSHLNKIIQVRPTL